MQTLFDSKDLRSLTKARGLLVFNFLDLDLDYYQIDVSPTSRQLSTEVLSYSKRQCQSLISSENRAQIFRILDYARRRTASRITRAGTQPIAKQKF
jgi:hypothetical protein